MIKIQGDIMIKNYFFTFLTSVVITGSINLHAQEKNIGDILIYNSRVTLLMPNDKFKGVPVLWQGSPTKEAMMALTFLKQDLITPEVLVAHENFEKVQLYYFNQFGRRGYDNKASMVQVGVNMNKDLPFDLGMKENAAWLDTLSMFGFGDGTKNGELQNFISSLEIVAHEFTHAVVSYTSNLEYVGQSGALNEHLADVFGAVVRQHYLPEAPNLFLIGDNALTLKGKEKAKALRDMQDPHSGLVWQPKDMSEVPPEFSSECVPNLFNDNCGVHILSGIPNKVFATVVSKLGWEKSSRLYYKVMTDKLKPTSQFADFKKEMSEECLNGNNLTASECSIIDDAFKEVGL